MRLGLLPQPKDEETPQVCDFDAEEKGQEERRREAIRRDQEQRARTQWLKDHAELLERRAEAVKHHE